jgi:hypothetical protein
MASAVAGWAFTWERIFQARRTGWHVSLNGRRWKRVLVKIEGE